MISKAFRALLLPGCLLAAAVALDRYGDPEWTPEAMIWTLARVSFALAFLLGLRFRRGRTAAAALLVAGVTELVHLCATGPASTLAAARVLLPLNLGVLAALGEFAPWSRRGAVRAVFFFLQAALIAPPGLRLLASLESLERAQAALLRFGIPRLEMLAFLLTALVLLGLLLRRANALEAGWLGALGAVWLGLHGPRPGTLLLAGGSILALALIQDTFALAFEDGLTGLPGRRALDERLRELRSPYALAMVDLDHFKKLNDRHGHDVGDQVLRLVASRLRGVQGSGVAYRYGGEEFTVLFAGKSVKEAGPYLESLRQEIAEHPFTVRQAPRSKGGTGRSSGNGGAARRIEVSVSIGLAQRGPRHRPPEHVLKAADRALYRAKRGGRNRVATTNR